MSKFELALSAVEGVTGQSRNRWLRLHPLHLSCASIFYQIIKTDSYDKSVLNLLSELSAQIGSVQQWRAMRLQYHRENRVFEDYMIMLARCQARFYQLQKVENESKN